MIWWILLNPTVASCLFLCQSRFLNFITPWISRWPLKLDSLWSVLTCMRCLDMWDMLTSMRCVDKYEKCRRVWDSSPRPGTKKLSLKKSVAVLWVTVLVVPGKKEFLVPVEGLISANVYDRVFSGHWSWVDHDSSFLREVAPSFLREVAPFLDLGAAGVIVNMQLVVYGLQLVVCGLQLVVCGVQCLYGWPIPWYPHALTALRLSIWISGGGTGESFQRAVLLHSTLCLRVCVRV